MIWFDLSNSLLIAPHRADILVFLSEHTVKMVTSTDNLVVTSFK